MRTELTILLVCLLGTAVCLPPAVAEEALLNVTANRNSIYLGESVQLTVKVSGMDNPPEPDLSEIKGCTVKPLGSHSDSHYSVVIINGRMQKESFSGRVFTYEVIPAAAGKIVIGPIKLRFQGKTTSVAGPSIDVADLEDQDEVFIEIKTSRETALVDEPFQILFSVAVKRLADPHADIAPLAPGDPPTLKVPFLEIKSIEGLRTPDIQAILNERALQPNAPGFAINDYTVRNDPFSGMFPFGNIMQNQKAKFGLDRREVTRDGESYFEYSLTLDYMPDQEGSYTFGPAVLTGNIVVDEDNTGRAILKRVFAVGPACTVRIVPPPEEDRPPSYVGAIGSNMVVEASLDCQTCNVGDPLTLKIIISGDVNMANIRPPSLAAQPGLLKDFKLYEDTVQTITGPDYKEYTYLLRPTRSGTFEFPPIEIAYYDTNERAYKIVRTEPIPIRANEASESTVRIIPATPTNEAAGRSQNQDEVLVPAPISLDPSGAEPEEISLKKWHLVTAAAGPILFVAVILFQQIGRRLARRRDTYRSRNAVVLAETRLKHSRKMLRNDPQGTQREICAALRQFLGDRLNVPAGGLTPGDTLTLIEKETGDHETANRFSAILERNFNAGYAQDQETDYDAVVEDLKSAIDVIRKIGAILKNRSRKS